MAQSKTGKKRASTTERRATERRTTTTSRADERRVTERRTKKDADAPDPDCEKHLRLATMAAQDAANALGIDHKDSPLLQKLEQLGEDIPTGKATEDIKDEFIAASERIREIADEEAKMAG